MTGDETPVLNFTACQKKIRMTGSSSLNWRELEASFSRFL